MGLVLLTLSPYFFTDIFQTWSRFTKLCLSFCIPSPHPIVKFSAFGRAHACKCEKKVENALLFIFFTFIFECMPTIKNIKGNTAMVNAIIRKLSKFGGNWSRTCKIKLEQSTPIWKFSPNSCTLSFMSNFPESSIFVQFLKLEFMI